MVLIFCFSSENSDESSETSGFFTQFIVNHFFQNYDYDYISGKVDHVVRKMAHFSIYASLGLCVSFSFGRRKFLSLKSLFSLGVCFLYACTDEFHQYFVPGRSCQFTDVMIDTSGALLGMIISLIILKIKKIHKN